MRQASQSLMNGPFWLIRVFVRLMDPPALLNPPDES